MCIVDAHIKWMVSINSKKNPDTVKEHVPFYTPKDFLAPTYLEGILFTPNHLSLLLHHSKNITSMRKIQLIKTGHTHGHSTLYT